MPTAQVCVVCVCCMCGAPVLLGTLRGTTARIRIGGEVEGCCSARSRRGRLAVCVCVCACVRARACVCVCVCVSIFYVGCCVADLACK